MAARLSFSQYRLEAEIERYRAGCQWDKIPALVEQLVSTRIHENDYGDLLLAESLLEECLLENMALLRSSTPLMDDSLPKLATAKSHLNKILNRGHLEPRYLNEALLLMAKVHYAQGRYRDAQGMCAKAVIDHLTQDEQPVYHLRLLAEVFVIKLSLDRQAVSSASRLRLSEREDECLSCYLRACDAALLYLQELDKLMAVGQPSKGTKYHISSGYLEFDLSFFQQAALQSAYLSLLHKAAARRLAEVLLSSISEDAYWDPLSPPPEDWLQREGPISSKEALLPTSRLPEYFSKDVFCPRDVVEEAVLLLLTTESMASGDAVISLTTDQKGAQEASLQDATSLYDMLTIGLARRGQFALLSQQRLEGAMKFSFNEFHLCYQLGLSFMASGKQAASAVSVLKECTQMQPDDPTLPLLAAKICINQLRWLEQGEALAQSVVAMGDEAGDFLPRAHLAIGLCYSLRATETLKVTQDDFNRRALESLQLLFTKVKLEEVLLGPEAALRTCEDMLQLWQSRYEGVRSDAEEGSNDSDPVTLSRKPSGTHLTLPDLHDVETGSQSAASVAASRLEQAWSEVSGNSSSHRQGPAHIWVTLERIWLQAELFMAERREKEAQFCAQEASAVSPASHAVLLLRGRLAELRGCDSEAKTLYDEALTIHPQGHRILMHMGQLLMRTGRRGLGEKMLRDAVQAQSTAHEAWSCLGEALQRQCSMQAADCFLTALELEASCPIRPFTIIAREL
uniref:Tetratricopeptide repeat domain 7A n=1 Tax=Paramormyrops kingsleyae TaxID=1676925 RepID=A0A3B3QGP1_9TELE